MTTLGIQQSAVTTDQQQKLCSAFHFSQSDLEANRAGHLSQHQQDSIKEGLNNIRRQLSYTRITLLALLVPIAYFMYWAWHRTNTLNDVSAEQNANVDDLALVVVVVGTFALFYGLLMLDKRRLFNQVRVVAGRAHSRRQLLNKSYTVRIGNPLFNYVINDVSDAQNNAFNPESQYRVYYIKTNLPKPGYDAETNREMWNQLLSIEYLPR